MLLDRLCTHIERNRTLNCIASNVIEHIGNIVQIFAAKILHPSHDLDFN